MFKKWLLVAALSLLSGSAFAACTNPLSIKDGSGAAISMSMTSNADGFCQYNFNMGQINGVAPLMGNGVTGTGSQRVTISSDNTAFSVNATAYGPTAVGAANANPPIIIGGTVTGAAGQNVGGVAVKPASTAAVTTDQSLVTSENPNSALVTAVNSTSVAVSTIPTAAGNPAVVVAIRPDSPGLNPLGPATVANSVPNALSSQYPVNAVTTTPTAITATATGTTAATAASLGATASVTNFVCGFTITADATALATGTATLSGTISGSMNYLQTIIAATSGASILTQNFNPCIPASAANTAITITSAAAGTGGNTIVNIWGYKL